MNLMFFLESSASIFSSYNLIIEASLIIIASFFFTEIAKRTNIPSVLMLIVLGIGLQYAMVAFGAKFNFFPVLELLGITGLIMIVLEAALELKLEKEKTKPILISLLIALVGLLLSGWAAATIIKYFYPEMSTLQSWVYATPLSILSSAIIIPSVAGLRQDKKEFHIYESTFSDIIGIMLFYFLVGNEGVESSGGNVVGFFGNLFVTIIVSFIASYIIVLIFQKIKSHVKLFLLISILLLLYAVGKKLHLSSLIIILIFGLLIANINVFFPNKLRRFIDTNKIKNIYDELHIITLETAFVVRTFFFVIFGITISIQSLLNVKVALISAAIIITIYLIRYGLLRASIGKDIFPQTYIAPRGLITILLFYAIPESIQLADFNSGVLLFVIIVTSIVMTISMIIEKNRSEKAINHAKSNPVSTVKWQPKKI